MSGAGLAGRATVGLGGGSYVALGAGNSVHKTPPFFLYAILVLKFKKNTTFGGRFLASQNVGVRF